MLEWLKRHAWKVCKRQKRFRGSNPCLSAPFIFFFDSFIFYNEIFFLSNEIKNFFELKIPQYEDETPQYGGKPPQYGDNNKLIIK